MVTWALEFYRSFKLRILRVYTRVAVLKNFRGWPRVQASLPVLRENLAESKRCSRLFVLRRESVQISASGSGLWIQGCLAQLPAGKLRVFNDVNSTHVYSSLPSPQRIEAVMKRALNLKLYKPQALNPKPQSPKTRTEFSPCGGAYSKAMSNFTAASWRQR